MKTTGFVVILNPPDPATARAVPEPGTALLLSLAVGALTLRRWRRLRPGRPEKSKH